MPTEIRWKSSLSATCMHAAACLRAGLQIVDPELAATLEQPVAALFKEIEDAKWPLDAVLAQLVGLAADVDNNRALVTRALARLSLRGVEGLINRVAGAIADIEAAVHRAQPEIVEELAVRGGPLREQWDARGPGMLREIARLTDDGVVPESAEIVLVSPLVGGAGTAYAAQNRVTLEAVLVNPHPQLPEIVRIAWLMAQLNSDLPRFAESLPPRRGGRAFALAMLAPALTAAETVELAPCDEAAIDGALDAWRLREDLPADAAGRLWRWWDTWLNGASSWPVAVAALDGLME
jgi:hypothetical protein